MALLRKKIKLFCFFVLFLTIVVACEDKFSDEDLFNKQVELGKDSIRLVLTVINASSSFTASSSGRLKESSSVSGATVALNVNGEVVTQDTDANGVVVFAGLQPGLVSGNIVKDGFTNTLFTLRVREEENMNGSNEPFTNASAVLPVLETTGANVAVVKGAVTAETNLLNSGRENVPDGTKISFSIVTSSPKFEKWKNSFLQQGGTTGTVLESIGFNGNFTAVTSGGKFSINLPVAHEGLEYYFLFSDFEADQTLAVDHIADGLPGSIRDKVTVPAIFKQLYVSEFEASDFRWVPSVRALQIDVEAPPASGSGAQATLSLQPSLIGYNFKILAAGTGYTPNSTTIPVTISGGDFDGSVQNARPAVLRASSDFYGRITGITAVDPGFGYRSRATLKIEGGGSGAIIQPVFGSVVAPQFGTGVTGGTTLVSGGSNYYLAPYVEFSGSDVNGVLQKRYSEANVVNGSVVSFTTENTLWAQTPTITFIPAYREQASVNPNYIYTNSLGEIEGVVPSVGAGYNPMSPPSVTIRDLKGKGTGAQLKAVVRQDGFIMSFDVVKGGSSYYSLSGSANYPSSAEAFSVAAPRDEYDRSWIPIQPGATTILDAHYGTGTRKVACFGAY